MEKRTSKIIAITTITATLITIFVFLSGKSDIYKIFKSNSNEQIAERKDGEDPIIKKLIKYNIKRVLVYDPHTIINKHIDETVGSNSRQRIKAAIDMLTKASSNIRGIFIDKMFTNSNSDYMRNIELIDLDESYPDKELAIQKAKDLSADALFDVKLTYFVIATDSIRNSALKVLGAIIGENAEKINVSVMIDISIIHADTGVLIYRITENQDLVKNSKPVK